jgi:hypothetical protein
MNDQDYSEHLIVTHGDTWYAPTTIDLDVISGDTYEDLLKDDGDVRDIDPVETVPLFELVEALHVWVHWRKGRYDGIGIEEMRLLELAIRIMPEGSL